MKSKILWTLSGILLLAIFALAWAPYGIKRYVHSKYPYVKVGGVALGFSRLTFQNVTVSKGWVEAEIATVTVDWDKNVNLYGGTVHVNLDLKKEGPPSMETKMGSLEGQDLYIHAEKDGIQANLVDSSFDSKEVRFGSAGVMYERHSLQLKEGRISRDGTTLKTKTLETSLEVPFTFPNIPKELKALVSGVAVNIPKRLVEFDSADVGPVTVKKHSKISLVSAAFRLELNDLEVNHPWVSPETVTFPSVLVVAPKTLKTVRVTLGKASIDVEPEYWKVTGSDTCNNWVEAMPRPLPLALEQALGNFSGNLTFEVVKEPAPQIKVRNDCRFTCSADPIKSLKSSKFSYMAYDKTDKLFRREVGPMAAGWVPIEVLPPYVPKAFITMEDPGFDSHRGIIVQALQNSLQDNLKLGKFFRGGSTITMQLAKNLWLKRHKTVGRKAQEALLTLALESCLTKAEILQLYVNVVEFGPNLYGIGPASKKYFDKDAAKLEPEEAFYLASILPAPRKAVPPGMGGLARTRALMATLASRGFISDGLVPLDDQDSEGWQTE